MTPANLHVFGIRMSGRMQPQLFDALLSKVGAEKQERILRFRNWQDAHRTLLGDHLLRLALSRSAGIHAPDLLFSSPAFGKPVIETMPHIHFNLSHAGRWIFCSVDNWPVGIDVEEVNKIDLSISEHYFFHEEHTDIVNDADPCNRFFDYWTLKESYIKFTGKGLSQPLNSFRIKFREKEVIGIETDTGPVDNVYFKQYAVEPGYKLALCAAHNSFPRNYTVCSMEELTGCIQ